MAWRLEGTYFENCPCDMVCPCTTSGLTMPADAERCRVTLVFHIDSGEIEGVDVSGLTVAPEGEVSKLTGVFHPANSTLTVARATTARINAFGLELSHDGKNGHSAPFSWAA
jgi:hypothetical protein